MRAALLLFVLAGLAGVLFRFSLVYGPPPGIDMGHLRHAHSHLMYFGWATPALMVLMARSAGRTLPRPLLWAAVGAALLAFPLFLLYGYTPAVIGGHRLPLSVMAAGLNVVPWYGFAIWLWRVGRQGWPAAFGPAVLFLLAATLGTWGLALSRPLGLHAPYITSALTHLFLDLFSEGWFVLGVAGLIWAEARGADSPLPHSLGLAAAGIALTWAYGMPQSLAGPWLAVAARGSALLAGLGLLALGLQAWRALPSARRGAWAAPIAFLMLKAGGMAVAALWPGLWPADHLVLRLVYLHLMLLGFVSTGLVAASGRNAVPMAAAAALVVGTLLLLGPVSAPFLTGRQAYLLAAWASLGPVVAAAAAAFDLNSRRNLPEMLKLGKTVPLSP